MDKQLQKMIAPRWIEEQQGVYIPLIDKVLLKDNVPEMPYNDYMDYAKEHNVQIATKEELRIVGGNAHHFRGGMKAEFHQTFFWSSMYLSIVPWDICPIVSQ